MTQSCSKEYPIQTDRRRERSSSLGSSIATVSQIIVTQCNIHTLYHQQPGTALSLCGHTVRVLQFTPGLVDATIAVSWRRCGSRQRHVKRCRSWSKHLRQVPVFRSHPLVRESVAMTTLSSEIRKESKEWARREVFTRGASLEANTDIRVTPRRT